MSVDWKAIAQEGGHRPWPLPDRPWIMTMSWLDLLFAHGRVDKALLRQRVPAALDLDLFEGDAWVSIVPFRMEHVSGRGLPDFPFVSAFAELNVRTYVTLGNKPGVYFFSLDAESALAVWGARTFFHLPYFDADIDHHKDDNGVHHYRSVRKDDRNEPGELVTTYRPTGPLRSAAPGLERFLVERYCLYAVDDDGAPWRGDINHAPWQLSDAEWAPSVNTVAPSGLGVNDDALLHFAERLDVVGWALERC